MKSFSDLPGDVLRSLSNQSLSLRDILSLVKTSHQNRFHLFSGDMATNLWRNLLIRDFGLKVSNLENAKLVYVKIYQERARMLAYAQVLMAHDAPVDPANVIQHFQNNLDLPENNTLSQLNLRLSLRQHKAFMERAALMSANVTPEEFKNRHIQLLKAYHALFAAPHAMTVRCVEELMPAIDNAFFEKQNVELNSPNGMLLMLISLLGKCGATYTLGMLLNKLSVTREALFVQAEFLLACGGCLCRDAAKYGHHDIVVSLLEKARLLVDEKLLDAYDLVNTSAIYSELFADEELLPLPSAMQALHDIVLSKEFDKLSPSDRENLLKEYREIIFTLCFYEAKVDIARRKFNPRNPFMANAVLLNGSTIQGDAVAMLDDIKRNPIPLSQSEFRIAAEAFSHVSTIVREANLDELEESSTDDDRTSLQPKHDRRYGSQNESDDEVEFKSPTKKGKTVADDDGVEFALSPERAEGPPSENAVSPVSRAIFNMSINK